MSKDSIENKLKKFLEFNNTKPEDYTNDGDTLSQDYKNFNSTKYVKLYNSYVKQWNNSTRITNNETNYKIGDAVIIAEDSDKKANEKGRIIFGYSKDNPSEMLKIEFKDGSKQLLNKMYVKKLTEQDYREE